jgi:hypothetical protein
MTPQLSTVGNRMLVCLYARYRFLDAEGPVRGDSSMSHNNDRNWLDVYRAAVMEFNRDKLPASIDVAEKAIHQRLRGLPIAHSKEHGKLRDALNSLAVLKRML